MAGYTSSAPSEGEALVVVNIFILLVEREHFIACPYCAVFVLLAYRC